MLSFHTFLDEQYLSEDFQMRLVPATNAFELLKQNHYLRDRMPRATKLVGAAFETGNPDPIAAVFFGFPARAWPVPVLELTRLVRNNDAKISLTQLISFATKQIKQNKQLPQLLISYADPAAGHHGGIYQAASWNFDQKKANYIDGADINGVFVPWRTLRHRYGTSSATAIKKAHPELDVQPHTAEGKYLYWRALDAKAERDANSVGLEQTVYPKPEL